MADTHSPRERLQLFRIGWQRGAGSKAIPANLKDDPDFQNGYREGRIAFNAAMAIAREHFGAPPPSILRAQEFSDVLPASWRRYGHPEPELPKCTCHLMDGGKMCAHCLATVQMIANQAKGNDDG